MSEVSRRSKESERFTEMDTRLRERDMRFLPLRSLHYVPFVLRVKFFFLSAR
jgi:hypothetical protein